MKRFLAGGASEILDISSKSNDIEEIISVASSFFFWYVVDTSTNVIYSSLGEYNLEDINLVDKLPFMQTLLTAMRPLLSSVMRNYTNDDLDEYWLTVASNEKVCNVILQVCIFDGGLQKEYTPILNKLLFVLSKVNPILYKKFYMEVKLNGIECENYEGNEM